MGSDVLAIDVGTTVFKLAVYDQDLKQKCQVLIPYEANLHERTWADIEPD